MTSAKIADGAVSDAKISGPIAGSKISTTGLNADQVDGLHASDFALYAHTHQDLQNQIAALQGIIADLQSQLALQAATLANLDGRVAGIEGNTILQLDGLVRLENATYSGAPGPNVVVEGANLHVVNGSGATEGTANGSGNLIVGYNESRGIFTPPDNRTGSHNIVLGSRQNYSSYGGMVAGWYNQILAPHASVLGGENNTASGAESTVCGGAGNLSSGAGTAVSGGTYNKATLQFSWVGGGSGNTASGGWSSVAGGINNKALSTHSSVAGGYGNQANGVESSAIGGYQNMASGLRSSVCGGSSNAAAGAYSSVSGGLSRAVSGDYDWAAGGLFEDQ